VSIVTNGGKRHKNIHAQIKIEGFFLPLGYAAAPMSKGNFTFRRKLLSLSSRVLEVLEGRSSRT
jgi:hypothetical protein